MEITHHFRYLSAPIYPSPLSPDDALTAVSIMMGDVGITRPFQQFPWFFSEVRDDERARESERVRHLPFPSSWHHDSIDLKWRAPFSMPSSREREKEREKRGEERKSDRPFLPFLPLSIAIRLYFSLYVSIRWLFPTILFVQQIWVWKSNGFVISHTLWNSMIFFPIPNSYFSPSFTIIDRSNFWNIIHGSSKSLLWLSLWIRNPEFTRSFSLPPFCLVHPTPQS